MTRNFFAHSLLRARNWQGRPQLDELCNWWRRGGNGVVALVGIGGAGKTAIVERFLRMLPDTLDDDPSIDKHDLLRKPGSTFVYSFYDNPSTDVFFESLQMWVENRARIDPPCSMMQLQYLLQQTTGLIVIDGLERIQEDGVRESFGRISCPVLRDFLDRVASGWMRSLSVIVTSRFPLADLRDANDSFFNVLAVDHLDVASGIRLLESRGVRGNELQLAALVHECGQHALTIDLAGGFLKEFCDGDSTRPLNLGSAEELACAAAHEVDDGKKRVLKQSIRFSRIAQRYRDEMLNADDAALALLERICLFRRGVDCETLACIFTGSSAESISGKALSALNREQLQEKLAWLVRLRIVEKQDITSSTGISTVSRPTYTVHPAVRDGFLQDLDQEIAHANHEAIHRGLESSLGVAPGRSVSEPATLDLLEEVIHHAIQTRNIDVAYTIYHERMGGCQNLIAGLNDYGRASRVSNAILIANEQNQRLPESSVAILQNDFGYSRMELGYVSTAVSCLELGREICARTRSGNLKVLARNLSYAQYLMGNISAALQTLDALISATRNPKHLLEMLKYRSELRLLQGETSGTVTIEDLVACSHSPIPKDVADSVPISICSLLLDPLSHVDEFRKIAERQTKSHPRGHESLSETLLELSERLMNHGETNEALRHLYCVKEWAVKKDARSFLCRCSLLEARVALVKVNRGEDMDVEPIQRLLGDGIKMSRNCGFGLYNIDLLIERARTFLLQGKVDEALADLDVALDNGIQENTLTGQSRMVAANDADCGYVWAVASGLEVRAEAKLLKGAQLIGQTCIDSNIRGDRPLLAQEIIDEARQILNEAMSHWCKLADLSTKESCNYLNNGQSYNFRAARTHELIAALDAGKLTEYPLVPRQSDSQCKSKLVGETKNMTKRRFKVALSFPGEHRKGVEDIALELCNRIPREQVFYDRFYEAELARPNLDTYLQRIYHDDTSLVVVFLCRDYNEKEWCHLEARAIRDMIKRRRDDEVMFIRVGDGEVAGVFSVDGYVDANGRSASDMASLILERVEIVEQSSDG